MSRRQSEFDLMGAATFISCCYSSEVAQCTLLVCVYVCLSVDVSLRLSVSLFAVLRKKSEWDAPDATTGARYDFIPDTICHLLYHHVCWTAGLALTMLQYLWLTALEPCFCSRWDAPTPGRMGAADATPSVGTKRHRWDETPGRVSARLHSRYPG